MNYYAFIKNTLGEWSLFAQGASKSEAVEALQPLLSAGFPSKSTKILRACCSEAAMAEINIQFTTFSGEVFNYPLHTKNPKKEFLTAVELAISKGLSDIAAVSLRDNRNTEMCTFNFGNMYFPSLSARH